MYSAFCDVLIEVCKTRAISIAIILAIFVAIAIAIVQSVVERGEKEGIGKVWSVVVVAHSSIAIAQDSTAYMEVCIHVEIQEERM